MSLGGIEKHLPEMRRKHVSEVARSPRGFLRHYRQAGGRASGDMVVGVEEKADMVIIFTKKEEWP